MKRIVVYTNGRRVQRHRVLLRASGLSAFHKRMFKGSHLPIVCKTQLLKFNQNDVVSENNSHSCGGLLEFCECELSHIGSGLGNC